MLLQTLIFTLPAAALGTKFRPENRPLLDGGLTNLPLFYNLSATVTAAQNGSADLGGSWWTSSFLHGLNNHDYFIVSHFMVVQGVAVSRASLLDLDTFGHSQMQNISTTSTTYNPTTGFADLQVSGFSFVAVNDTDPTAEFHLVTNVPDAHIDLTFEGNSPALINGALGDLPVDGAGTFEWSIPAGRTSGSLVVNGTKVDISPSRSITWFDREWGPGMPSSWHWFELHLLSADPSELDVVASAWAWDDPVYGHKQFGTFREAPGVMREVPIKSLVIGKNWTSPATGLVYGQEYALKFWDGSAFDVSIVTPDQELRSGASAENAGYDGYATVKGTYQGRKVTGYAVVEVVYDDSI